MTDEPQNPPPGLELAIDFDHGVDEVPVEAMEVPVEEAEHLLRAAAEPAGGDDPAPLPPADRPARSPGARAAAEAARGKGTRGSTDGRLLPATDWGDVLSHPGEWLPRIVQFVLYSGMSRNNPLIVTLRLLALLIPLGISMWLTMYSMSVFMPVRDSLLGARLSSSRPGAAVLVVDGRDVDVPLPEGFTIVPDVEKDFFGAVPLSRNAVARDKQRLVFAALSPDMPHFFVSVGMGTGTAAAATSEREFKSRLKNFIQDKQFASFNQVGMNQGIDPYDETERSVSYGLSLGEEDIAERIVTSFRQYSCLLFFADRPLVLNVGYSVKTGEGEADPDWCKETLRAWRDRVLAGGGQ